MAPLTMAEVDKIAEAVKGKLISDNPGFVPETLCSERIGTIRKMLYGLYILVGSMFLLVLGAMVTSVIPK